MSSTKRFGRGAWTLVAPLLLAMPARGENLADAWQISLGVNQQL
jgi:hypothetical protein